MKKNTTDEIMADKNRIKKLWKHITELQGVTVKTNKTITLYEGNEEIKERDIPEKLTEYLKEIYEAHENNIKGVWNETVIKDYKERLKNKGYEDITVINIKQMEYQIPENLRENFDMITCAPSCSLEIMTEPALTAKDVKHQLEKLRFKKAPGPD